MHINPRCPTTPTEWLAKMNAIPALPEVTWQIDTNTPTQFSPKTAVILGVWESGVCVNAAYLPEACQSLPKKLDFKAKIGSTKTVSTALLDGENLPDNLILIGLGNGEKPFTTDSLRKILHAANAAAVKTRAENIVFDLQFAPDAAPAVRTAALNILDISYQFHHCKGTKTAQDDLTPHALQNVTFLVNQAANVESACQTALTQAQAIAAGQALSKTLGNLPGNICTPRYLAAQAEAIAAQFPEKLTAKILEPAELRALGMGAFMGVAQGSDEPARLIILEYKNSPNADDAPIALVGKGLTFDCGGISIKPSGGMDEMKFDMCGGAGVLGALLAAAQLNLPLNIVGVVPSTENLINGIALKPGDIVTTMSGITVEINNTDAEGRLILCDAMTYTVQNYKPRALIDLATLTGACVVALGPEYTGLFSHTPELAAQVLAASETAGEKTWELPLPESYNKMLKSNFADLMNCSTGRYGGAITAALYLQNFVKDVNWVHLDIAGPAWHMGGKSTGRPVPLLVQFLLDQAG